jgi:hypothetical protein
MIQFHTTWLTEILQPAIDVEMRITDEGKGLDIGVFAPVELLDLKAAMNLAGGLGNVLSFLA